MTFAAPTPNFTLTAKQSVHPQLAPGFKVEWSGFLKVPRAGEYTISGASNIFLDGKEVNGPTKLAAGEVPLRIAFQRSGTNTARVQLQWQSEFFAIEPIPASAFVHAGRGTDALLAHGRELVENFGCASCHKTGSFVKTRRGPILSQAGSRLKPEWIYHWLENPRHFRPDTTMPTLLHTEQERADVTAFLATLVATNSAPKGTGQGDRGAELFQSTGCVACHTDSARSLAGLGSKYQTPGDLAAYLRDPLAISPAGLMPDMLLKRDEANHLAEWLCQSRNPAFESPIKSGDPARGRQLAGERGCANCHAIEGISGIASKTFDLLQANEGCLSPSPTGNVPRFALTEPERAALIAYVQSPDKSEAPVQDFHRAVKQLDCRGCHELNGPAQLAFEGNQAPPPLTDSGNKLRRAWLEQVLHHKKRVRPWMQLRMPHYSAEQVARLVDSFAAQAGAELGDRERVAKPAMDLVQHGTKLIGRDEGGLSCINCHDFRAEPSGGDMRGPDMTEMDARIRPDWLARWLRDPARIQPGTAMPAFFSDMPAADREPKIAALIGALAAGKHMPTPAGLSESAQAYLLLVKDEPVVFRSFIQDSSPRSIAVGLPGLNSFVFDAQLCRLRYAWSGDFLDVKPVWSDRGGSQAKILGAKYYTAPNAFPLRIGAADSEPRVQFKGYTLVGKLPQFHYTVDGVNVRELIASTPGRVGLERTFTFDKISGPAWFLAPPSKEVSITSSVGELVDEKIRIEPGENVRLRVTMLAR